MARPCLGTAFQLPALEPGDGAGQRGLAQPGGEVEPAPLPRRLAPKPAGIRLPGGLPLLTSLAPQSVTVRKNCSLCPRPRQSGSCEFDDKTTISSPPAAFVPRATLST